MDKTDIVVELMRTETADLLRRRFESLEKQVMVCQEALADKRDTINVMAEEIARLRPLAEIGEAHVEVEKLCRGEASADEILSAAQTVRERTSAYLAAKEKNDE